MDVLIAYHGMARGSLDPTCGDRFTVSGALLCKGDFVAQRHDGIQNILTSLLSKVCKGCRCKAPPPTDRHWGIQPKIHRHKPLRYTGHKGRKFWSRGETVFFDVCRTHVNSTCNQNKSTESIFVEHEKDKKRNYQQTVIDVEMGSFPPFFWHERRNGEGMQAFSKQPSGQTFPPPKKKGKSYASAISCFKTSISFEIFTIRPHICSLGGSRSPFHKDADFLDDFSVNAKNADIFKISFSMLF